MNTLIVAWQDEASRQWSPVGRLDREEKGYCFSYTQAVESLDNFRLFGGMPDRYKKYYSDVLFPLFANRTLPKSRPEYKSYMSWLGLDEKDDNLMLELSRTFGARVTDSIEIIPLPEPTPDNKYEIYFFARGHKYFVDGACAPIENLEQNRKLFLMHDIQNSNDKNALLLRTEDPLSLVGYIPRYFNEDIAKLLEINGENSISVTLVRANSDAPTQYNYLCKLSTEWPPEFKPFSSEKFRSLA